MVNQNAIEMATRKVMNGEVELVAKAIYDVAVDGGAAATYELKTKIPKNSIVLKVMSDEKTALAGGTNITFYAGSTALTGAIALSAFTGVDNHALAGSAAGIKVSADSELKVVTTGTHSTGKIEIFVHYVKCKL